METARESEYPRQGAGDPHGPIWAPAESDVPNRKRRWFWKAGEEQYLYSLDELVDLYYHSVGRNTNLLFGMVIDDRGLVPEADAARFGEFGAAIERRFRAKMGETAGRGDDLLLDLGGSKPVSHVIIKENIAEGERVRAYVLQGLVGGTWLDLAHGTCIGHKRIERFRRVRLSQIRLRCLASVAPPSIASLAAYDVTAD